MKTKELLSILVSVLLASLIMACPNPAGGYGGEPE